MDVSDDDFLILEMIERCSALGHPCPASLVSKAVGLVEKDLVRIKGEVAKNGMADLYIPDEVKWKLLAGGRFLKS